jgi:hypothetical protein
MLLIGATDRVTAPFLRALMLPLPSPPLTGTAIGYIEEGIRIGARRDRVPCLDQSPCNDAAEGHDRQGTSEGHQEPGRLEQILLFRCI